MIDRTLLQLSPEVYTRHKGTLTPEEVWEVQEVIAQRYLTTHGGPVPQPEPMIWPQVFPRRPTLYRKRLSDKRLLDKRRKAVA
jgi:hypothetical protein